LGPLFAFLVDTLAILVAWTVQDPWQWERFIVSELPYETYGACKNDRFWAFFGPLMGLLIFAEGTSAFFAWKTADIPEDFRDSNSVLFAICTHIQAWAIGLPILTVLGNSRSNAAYLGRVLLIWLFAVSSLACVVYPKLARAISLRLHPERRQKKRVAVTGLTAPTAESRPRTQSSGMHSLDHSDASFTIHKGREAAVASSITDRPTELSGSTEPQQAYLRVADLEAQLEDYKRRFANEIVTT
jgi:hypothetical protein